MKIKHIKESNKEKTSWKDSLFINFHFILEFYKYIALLIIGLGLTVFMILLAMDYVIPNELKDIDQKTTLKLFDDLQQSNKHQTAILLMEYKGNSILNDSTYEFEYKLKLSDSYIHVGDYSKAEKMLLDVWNNLPVFLDKIPQKEKKNYPGIETAIQFSIARQIYQFYEIIGDKNNQKKFFNIYRSYNNKTPNVDHLFTSISQAFSKDRDIHTNVKDLVKYDSIVVISLDDKDSAIKEMKQFISKIINKPEFGPAYKVKCLNKLIKWDFDKDDIIDAYLRINQAVDLVKRMSFNYEYKYLGELSDYCYQIHDIEMSKILFKLYQGYLDAYFDKTDYDYLANYERSFRYLEAEEKWDQLTDDLENYCIGMRKQIALNIPSMTEEQREFFAKHFEGAYNYSLHALQLHPSSRLANLCFDNITFRNGLLLRSNQSLSNSIELIGDASIKKKYEELKECRNNLAYLEISGKTFFNDKEKVKQRIDDLEKEIALKCTDFKTKNSPVDIDYKKLQSYLKGNDAIVDLIEHENELFALVLLPNSSVKYTYIGNFREIAEKLKRPIHEIYHDEHLTSFLWSKINNIIGNCNMIYYVPIGMFNQISLGALYTNNGYLADSKTYYLLSNPSDIIEEEPVKLSANITSISLWGGIDYGYDGAISDLPLKRNAIKRGDVLCNLSYAYQEVMDISEMLNTNSINNLVYSKSEATEKTFKDRDGKKDYIIHVSTHGFFNDQMSFRNSMFESGLFFAGANKYWTNDTLNIEYGQEDGILRAAEIAGLNLSGCSLVVLSACETGLGYSDTSEGVYGLQRAFKLAGARQIIMSLWDVDDRATTMLMTEFYQNLLNNMDADSSLEKAKQSIREIYPSPEYWGAFVLLH